jgi:hypothetical protein
MSKILVQREERQPKIELSDKKELYPLFDDIVSNTDPEYPTIIQIYVHGYQIGLGLGHDLSFVHFEQANGEPPYFITIGDPNAAGVLAFYLFNNHHTEIPRRNLIPTSEARAIVSEYVDTAVRSSSIEWEEV